MLIISTTDYSNKEILYAEDFKKMIIGAAYFFSREKETINSLNVFPVPDGDTGTNMSMTLIAAAEGCLDYRGASIGELSAIAARRALMGARGNSGVILSQFLRGLARGLREKISISPAGLSKAFQYGVVYAYKAVSRPVEGTILTVSREMARGARAAARNDHKLDRVLEEAIRSGREALDRTTEQLPVLKEAGVVDAGGMGLVVFLEGCRTSLRHSLGEILEMGRLSLPAREAPHQAKEAPPLQLPHPYCTELLIKGDVDSARLRSRLEPLGDSLLVVPDEQLTKIHIHTAVPDQVLKVCLACGTLHDIKIENMLDQHTQTVQKKADIEPMVTLPARDDTAARRSGIIAVSFGEGFRDIFLNLGAEEVVFGGQTMNPKVEDLVAAVQNLSGSRGIILPNNKNIIMVAQQVPGLTSKEVAVLQTRTLPQGLAALIAYNRELDFKENLERMQAAAGRVKSGEVTYATRSTQVNGLPVNKGDCMGLQEGIIRFCGPDRQQVTLDLVAAMLGPEDEIVTVFYGREVPEDEAAALARQIEKNHSQVEVELKYGGQPIYYYIIAVE